MRPLVKEDELHGRVNRGRQVCLKITPCIAAKLHQAGKPKDSVSQMKVIKCLWLFKMQRRGWELIEGTLQSCTQHLPPRTLWQHHCISESLTLLFTGLFFFPHPNCSLYLSSAQLVRSVAGWCGCSGTVTEKRERETCVISLIIHSNDIYQISTD